MIDGNGVQRKLRSIVIELATQEDEAWHIQRLSNPFL
jgi:hypothetical protein